MKGQRDMESDLDEVRGGLTEKVAFEQSPEGGEGALVAAGGRASQQREQQVERPGF